MKRELVYQELYEDLPCIAEMDFTFHGKDFFYEVCDKSVYILDRETGIYIFEMKISPRISEEELDRLVMKVFDAKLFDGKTIKEAQKDITIESLTYRKDGKYE